MSYVSRNMFQQKNSEYFDLISLFSSYIKQNIDEIYTKDYKFKEASIHKISFVVKPINIYTSKITIKNRENKKNIKELYKINIIRTERMFRCIEHYFNAIKWNLFSVVNTGVKKTCR
ncbi:hypothetical protein CDIK_2914 [Cucumispora dikerogammari]|nr:hypothetical protein CDIK_2914 [Cucumispora dikerogammari]